MATIDDLKFNSIMGESTDEAIERLRQIRLSRRTPVKKVTTPKKATSKSVSKAVVGNLDKKTIDDLLNMID